MWGGPLPRLAWRRRGGIYPLTLPLPPPSIETRDVGLVLGGSYQFIPFGGGGGARVQPRGSIDPFPPK